MVGAAHTRAPEGGVLEDFGTAVPTRAMQKYYPFFNVPLQELIRTLQNKIISIQVDLLPTTIIQDP